MPQDEDNVENANEFEAQDNEELNVKDGTSQESNEASDADALGGVRIKGPIFEPSGKK